MRTKLTLCAGVFALAACSDGQIDLDVRDLGNGFDTTPAVQNVTADRPEPDSRGVISYPNYQVAVARRGDTVAVVAERVGVPAQDLARYNGVPVDASLNPGEVLALPQRVAETSTGPIQPAGQVDVESLASDAIDRAEPTAPSSNDPVQTGKEPTRHRVEAGETAYSISRLYGVSPKSLAEWNGLGQDLEVRVGQYLMIPVVVGQSASAETSASTTAPGAGSPTPTPPSSAKPLPDEPTATAGEAAAAASGGASTVDTPESPNLSEDRTSASGSGQMVTPVSGPIVRDFSKGRNDGIDIAAPGGTPVKAADSGTVAAITQDTDQVPILVLRHDGGLLTVYANVDNLTVKKGQSVKRGQTIASVRAGESSSLHFEVRKGVDAVDPTGYLN